MRTVWSETVLCENYLNEDESVAKNITVCNVLHDHTSP